MRCDKGFDFNLSCKFWVKMLKGLFSLLSNCELGVEKCMISLVPKTWSLIRRKPYKYFYQSRATLTAWFELFNFASLLNIWLSVKLAGHWDVYYMSISMIYLRCSSINVLVNLTQQEWPSCCCSIWEVHMRRMWYICFVFCDGFHMLGFTYMMSWHFTILYQKHLFGQAYLFRVKACHHHPPPKNTPNKCHHPHIEEEHRRTIHPYKYM